MKRYSSIIHILSLACAGLIFAGCATNQAGLGTAPAPANSGHLLVSRVAKFWVLISSCLVSRWQGRDKPERGSKLRWLLAGRSARSHRPS